MKDPKQLETINPNTGRLKVQTVNTEPSKTQQQFSEECDINNIMKKYVSTGEFLGHIKTGGIYADFSDIQDYQSMLDTVIYADQAFQTLPAPVRAKFRNDPGSLLTFLQNPANKAEAIELGLIERPIVPTIPSEPPKL